MQKEKREEDMMWTYDNDTDNSAILIFNGKPRYWITTFDDSDIDLGFVEKIIESLNKK